MNFSGLETLRGGETIILLAAIVVSLAGMSLLLYSARMTRQALGRRIDRVRSAGVVPIRAAGLGARLVRSGAQGVKERETREAAKLLLRFGVSEHQAVAVMVAARVVAAILLAALAFWVAAEWSLTARIWLLRFPIASVFGFSGWLIPGILISRAIKTRTQSIVNGLPDALELLVICVEAGLSFEDGIDRIARVLRASQPALSEELALTAADLKILPGREDALTNLSMRVDTPSVRTVATTLAQTLRYGTPLAQALRIVAGELRKDTMMRLEERANALPSLMTIPMMLFIMPTIFMVIGGPAALRVIDSLKP